MTPETDALREAIDNGTATEAEMTSLAGKLERERDEALSQIVKAECRAERFCQERDEAREDATNYYAKVGELTEELNKLKKHDPNTTLRPTAQETGRCLQGDSQTIERESHPPR